MQHGQMKLNAAHQRGDAKQDLRPDRYVFACENRSEALRALHETVGTGLRTAAPAAVAA